MRACVRACECHGAVRTVRACVRASAVVLCALCVARAVRVVRWWRWGKRGAAAGRRLRLVPKRRAGWSASAWSLGQWGSSSWCLRASHFGLLLSENSFRESPEQNKTKNRMRCGMPNAEGTPCAGCPHFSFLWKMLSWVERTLRPPNPEPSEVQSYTLEEKLPPPVMQPTPGPRATRKFPLITISAFENAIGTSHASAGDTTMNRTRGGVEDYESKLCTGTWFPGNRSWHANCRSVGLSISRA